MPSYFFDFLNYFGILLTLENCYHMRTSHLFLTLIASSLALTVLQGCTKKENGIDNETVITRPYGLYVANNQGALFNSNDGVSYKIIFPPDGVIPRAIVTSRNNLVWIKQNVHLSEDNGKNFNPTYTKVPINAPWQSVVLNVPSHDRLYLCSTEGFGIVYSENNGKTWTVDTKWDAAISGAAPRSLTLTRGGVLFAHDFANQKLYKRLNKNADWTEVTMNGLPGGAFYLSHVNDVLILTDILGTAGAWYSNDQGQNWLQYTGLPTNHILFATAAPFDQTVLVGTDSMGVWRLEGTNFVASNAGLDNYTVVRAIVGKDDIYKNGAVKRYVYMATNKGLYRSEDLGRNWIRVKDGDYTTIY